MRITVFPMPTPSTNLDDTYSLFSLQVISYLLPLLIYLNTLHPKYLTQHGVSSRKAGSAWFPLFSEERAQCQVVRNNEWMHEWVSEWVNEWTNEPMNEWANGVHLVLGPWGQVEVGRALRRHHRTWGPCPEGHTEINTVSRSRSQLSWNPGSATG